jgi:GT2 family glycosyltransferase
MVIADREEVQQGIVATTATILLCAWRNLVVETAECVLQMRDLGWGYVFKRGDALITRSRSRVVSDWYRETNEDVFLMVDDDVVWKPEDAVKVVELAREKRGIAIGAYAVKDGRHLACRRFPDQVILFGEDSPPVEIQWPATGFMAVHRDVLDAMVAHPETFPLCDVGIAPTWMFFDAFTIRHEDGHHEPLSEDYAFGYRARELGFGVWLDPSVILWHMGTFPYDVHHMDGSKVIEAAE